jgi:peptidyl-prolyl cis-trans isomerase D
MALIGTLRSKAGTWVVVFVFVAIAAFILGDLFSGNSNILNWGRNSVGEIGGKEVSYEEFQSAVREREATYYLQTGREANDREMTGIRQQAWDLLVARYAVEPQYEKVGIVVTDDEVVDMISGVNIDPAIKQSFTNPQTGEFDRATLGSYIKKIQADPPTSPDRVRWEFFQKDLKPSRERIKYENLLLKSSYVTKAEAERLYHTQTDVAEVKYVYVPYYAISDSAAQVTDSDLKDYYNKHVERFKTEASRDIKYIAIPVVPSADDSAAITEDLRRTAIELKRSTTANEDSSYVATNSDGQNPYAKYSPATLPAFIDKDSLVQGKVFGPFADGDTYKVVKVSKIFNDTIFNASARHILIKWNDESDAAKKEAKEKAQGILKDLKGGADFVVKAREFSQDPSNATRGGDLGSFNQGMMVKPFDNAVFNATKTGLVNDVVETQFGYHIIDVTKTKNNKAYMLSIVERQVLPSDATSNEAFRKAETFAADISDVEEFEQKAKEMNIPVLEAKSVLAGDRRLGTLGDARILVQWLFREAAVDKVSQVYELDGQNVVAIMTGEVKKGYKPLEMVKDEITPEVQKEVKGKLIIEKLKGLSGTLEEVAQSFGSDANVYSTSDLRLSSNSLPTVGFDPQAVGVAFSLEKNAQRSKPVAGENGVVLLELQNKTIAPAAAEYSTYKSQLEQNDQNRAGMSIGEAIKDYADIVDKRYKFF